VACVGDSITAGANASDVSKNYVSQLQVLLGNTVQVKNFGHSGATPALGRLRRSAVQPADRVHGRDRLRQ